MPGLVSVARGKAIAAVTLALAAGALATGCDTQEEADLERGRDLFTEKCGTCHALTEARTAADIGPDLDASFAEARANGMDDHTIEGVIEAQIDNPRGFEESNPIYDQVFMPADLVSGSDATDVAAYVASVAGVEGIEPPPLGDGSEIFISSCGGCHALEDAGTPGGVGPALDEVLPGQDAEAISQSIRDPQAEISEGFDDPSQMPQFDANQIPDENLQELIDYLIEATGGGYGQRVQRVRRRRKVSPRPLSGRSQLRARGFALEVDDTCVTGCGSSARARSTTPDSSQRERLGVWVEITTSSAGNTLSASSIA